MKRLLVLGLVSCGSVSGVSIDATPTATVTVTKGGTGTGTVTSTPAGINCGTSCSGSFSGSVVLTATPDAGSTFTGWSGGTCSGTGTCSLSPTSNVAITATFDLPTPQMLTVTKSGDGTGTVTSSIGGINCGTTCTGVV